MNSLINLCVNFIVMIDAQLSRDISRRSINFEKHIPPLFTFSTHCLLHHMVNEIIARRGGTLHLFLRRRFPTTAAAAFHTLRLTIRDPQTGWRDRRQLRGIVSYKRPSSLRPIIHSLPKWTLNRGRFRQTRSASVRPLPSRVPRFLPSRTIIYDYRPGCRLWFVVYRLYRPAASFRTPFVKPDGNR